MPTVPSTDGITVAVHDLGGSGNPVLFSHATGFHGHVFQPIADRLPRVHSWAVDLRGHGDSVTPPGHPMAWPSFADDVLAALTLRALADEAAVAPLVGVGHSGGGAALALAEARRPGTFAALWLFEPVIFPPEALVPTEGGSSLAEGARMRRPTFPSRDAAYANYASKPPMNAFAPEALRAYVEHGFRPDATEAGPDEGPVTIKCRPEDESATYAQAATSGAFDSLADVKCPVVIARGHPEGGANPSRFADRVAEALPDGRLEVFDDLGHFAPMQDPARIAASIQALLDSVPA
jgi:pimeloyl-ACP methyl ester carboxylesterase